MRANADTSFVVALLAPASGTGEAVDAYRRLGKARGSVVRAFPDLEWRLAWSQAPRAAAAFCRVIVRRFGYPARMARALLSASKFHLLRAS